MKILVFVGIYLLVSSVWWTAEKIMYGKVTPRLIDDLVAIVITMLIYDNIY